MTDIITSTDINTVMRSSGTLIYFHETKWSAKVMAPKEAAAAAQAAGADPDSLSAHKFLLPGVNTEYRAVCREIDRARATHNRLTVPWGRRKGCGFLFVGVDGQAVFDYLDEIAKHEQKIINSREAFKSVYLDAVKKAKANLGSMWNADDYIRVDEIDHRFGISIEFDPIPVDDDWMGLPSGTLNKILTQHTNKRGQRNVQMAINAGMEKLRKYVSHMHKRLADPETKRFYSSMVDNIGEVIELIEPFNFLNDAEFTEILDGARELTQHTTDQIKNSESLRSETAKKARQLEARLAEYTNIAA